MRNFKGLIWLNIRQYLTLVSVKYNDPEKLILKHPELTYYFYELSKHFHNFKFIVIVRDPHDVIASIIRVAERHIKTKTSSPQTNLVDISKHCENYASYYADVIKNLGNFYNRLIFVKYEDFMNEPSKQLLRISQFSGARYDANRAIEFLPEHASSPNFDKEEREGLVQRCFLVRFVHTTYFYGQNWPVEVLNDEQVKEIEHRLQPFGNRFNYW